MFGLFRRTGADQHAVEFLLEGNEQRGIKVFRIVRYVEPRIRVAGTRCLAHFVLFESVPRQILRGSAHLRRESVNLPFGLHGSQYRSQLPQKIAACLGVSRAFFQRINSRCQRHSSCDAARIA